MGLREQILEMERMEGEELGKVEGKMETIKQIITNMLRNNFPDEMIVKATAMPHDYVQKIRMTLK